MSHSTVNTTSNGALRLALRRIGGASRQQHRGQQRQFRTAVSQNGTEPTVLMATRPSNHRLTTIISGRPAKPRAPVQLGTAVSRNPAMAAITKPNSISCECQYTPGSAPKGTLACAKRNSHSGTIASA